VSSHLLDQFDKIHYPSKSYQSQLVCRVTLSLMPTDQILSLLLAERDKLSRAIEALQGPTKRRGRPPKNPVEVTTTAAAPAPARKKRKFSAAQRRQQAERMRAYWAAKKAPAKPQAKTAKKTKKTAKKSAPVKKKRVAKKTATAPAPAATEA